MAEGEVIPLKKEIRKQYITMQKLYAELEEEREASASAANEALSMILRLQVEKAAEKMEACQYKRMAEEKMRHADESLEICEELLSRKEMEIAFLKFQIQAYWEILSHSGASFPNVSEDENSGNSFLICKTNAFLDNMSFHGIVRRNISMPSIKFKKFCSEMDNTDTGTSSTTQQSCEINVHSHQENDGVQQELSNVLGEPTTTVNFNPYCEQAEKGNMNLKETSQTRNIEDNIRSDCILPTNELLMVMPIDRTNLREESRSSSWYSAVSHETSNDSTIGMTDIKLNVECTSSSFFQAENMEIDPDFDAFSCSSLEDESDQNAVHSVSVHDIYEVPQSHSDHYLSEPQKEVSLERTLNKEMLNLMQNEALNCPLKEDECIRKAVLYPQNWERRLSKPIEGVSANYYWAIVDPKIDIRLPQTDVEKLQKQLQLLDDGKRIMRHKDFDRGKEQLKLLREINEKLTMIHTDIRKPKLKKCHPQDESSLVSMMEAMLSFSI